MRSIWHGRHLTLTVEGGSHDPALAGELTGLPAGIDYDEAAVRTLLARRAPGGRLSTTRTESDEPIILSGISGGRTTGGKICLRVENHNARSSDYGEMAVPRPSHADYPAYVKYHGQADLRGGGHFSGRLTVIPTFFGGVCLGFLRQRRIAIGAHLLQVGAARDTAFDPLRVSREDFAKILSPGKEIPTLGDGEAIKNEIERARAAGDSVGALVECAAVGLPVGLGEHIFYSVEGVLSSLLYGIPACKGISFGEGFAFARLHGSEANDGYAMEDGRVSLLSNHCGGIAGGMTTGAPLLFTCAFKPTPSIYTPQSSVNLATGENALLQIRGRHDPCVALRAVPVVEAMTALALTDLLLDEEEARRAGK